MAKKTLVLVLLMALTVPVLGCGVGSTPADNRRAATRVVDYDARMLVDDLALFLQLRRPVRASRWVID
jgi:hypothetical protein